MHSRQTERYWYQVFVFFCFFTKFHHTHLTILHWKYLYTLLQYFIKPWIIGNIYTVQAVDAKLCCYTSLCQHVDDLRSTMWCLRAGGKQYQWGHYKKIVQERSMSLHCPFTGKSLLLLQNVSHCLPWFFSFCFLEQYLFFFLNLL